MNNLWFILLALVIILDKKVYGKSSFKYHKSEASYGNNGKHYDLDTNQLEGYLEENNEIANGDDTGYDKLALADYIMGHRELEQPPFNNPYELKVPSNFLLFHSHNTIGTNNFQNEEGNSINVVEGSFQQALHSRFKRQITFKRLLAKVQNKGAESGVVLKDHANCGRGRRRRPDAGNGEANGNTGGETDETTNEEGNAAGAEGETEGGAAEQLRVANGRINNRRKNIAVI